MELTSERIEVPRFANTQSRYLLVEPDGVCIFSGYYQRPAAERNAKVRGHGVYDQREKEIVLQPDQEKFMEHLRSQLESAEANVEQLRERIESLEVYA